MSECWLYRAYASIPRKSRYLLYVGISDTPSDRMAQHCSDKWWWSLVDSLGWYRAGSRDQALRWERDEIKTLLPLFNRQQSSLTATDRLMKCGSMAIEYRPVVCPICDTEGQKRTASSKIAGLRFNRAGECCFDFVMSCDGEDGFMHEPVKWSMLVNLSLLLNINMPIAYIDELWSQAECEGSVSCYETPSIDCFSFAHAVDQSFHITKADPCKLILKEATDGPHTQH